MRPVRNADGHTAFEGDTFPEIFAAVLKTDPDWRRLPATTPEAVRRLLRRCLQKDVKLRDIGDARLDIDDARSELVSPPPSVTGVRRTRRLGWLAVLGAALMVPLAMRVWPTGRTSAPPEARFEILTPLSREPDSLAISPDGKALVFAATFEGRTRLWLRSIDSVAIRSLAGTDGAQSPFWSPDSRSVAFYADGKLRRIDLDGGAVLSLADSGAGGGGT